MTPVSTPLPNPSVPSSMDTERTVVRAGSIWWFTAAAAAGANLFFILVTGLQPSSTGDQIGTGLVGGALLAATVAVATSRLAIRGRTLLAVTSVQVLDIDASQIASVEDDNGLCLVLNGGRRLELGITQPSLAQQLIKNERRRREAAIIRDWAAGLAPVPSGLGAKPRRRVRWRAVLAVPAWALGSVALTLALHALLVR